MSVSANLVFPDRFEGLWIPREIFELRKSPIEAIILAEVRALQKERGCFASNSHFSALVGVKDRSLRKHITALEDAGHIYAEGRNSGRRRLWIGDELAASIDAREGRLNKNEEQPTRNDRAALSPTTGKPKPSHRQVNAADPGTVCADPAVSDRPTRHLNATENTSRIQLENTKKNTTGDLDFSNLNASTHLLNDQGVRLASLETWGRWMRYSPGSWLASSLTEEEQIEKLSEMVLKGFDGETLLRECLRTHRLCFWESMPSYVIPAHLRGEYS